MQQLRKPPRCDKLTHSRLILFSHVRWCMRANRRISNHQRFYFRPAKLFEFSKTSQRRRKRLVFEFFRTVHKSRARHWPAAPFTRPPHNPLIKSSFVSLLRMRECSRSFYPFIVVFARLRTSRHFYCGSNVYVLTITYQCLLCHYVS